MSFGRIGRFGRFGYFGRECPNSLVSGVGYAPGSCHSVLRQFSMGFYFGRFGRLDVLSKQGSLFVWGFRASNGGPTLSKSLNDF